MNDFSCNHCAPSSSSLPSEEHHRSFVATIYRGIYRGIAGIALGAFTAPSLIAFAATPALATPQVAAQAAPVATSVDASNGTLNGSQYGGLQHGGAIAPPQAEPTPIARAVAEPEIRSIWLDRETIVNAGSPEGLAPIFDRFHAAGINTVFVETVNAGYPIYPSSVAPEQNPLTRSWDPLQAAIELGQDYNIEVHAWVWLFAAGNQAHNRILGQHESYPGPLLSARPDWAGFDNRGNLIIPGQNKPFLDPANPEVRQYLLDLLSEIATHYDVDGIQFDYVRYPFQNPAGNYTFGYGTAAREQFHQLTGVDPITLRPQNGGDPRLARLWSQWTDFRAQQISSFVAAASRQLRNQRPDLTLSAAVFADNTYKRHHDLQQDWEDWADQGLVDWIVLMSYANSTERFVELIRPWVLESSFRTTQVIPGIRLLNLPTSEAFNQIQALRDMPVNGYALFAADNLDGEVQSMLAGVNDDLGVAIATKNE